MTYVLIVYCFGAPGSDIAMLGMVLLAVVTICLEVSLSCCGLSEFSGC